MKRKCVLEVCSLPVMKSLAIGEKLHEKYYDESGLSNICDLCFCNVSNIGSKVLIPFYDFLKGSRLLSRGKQTDGGRDKCK